MREFTDPDKRKRNIRKARRLFSIELRRAYDRLRNSYDKSEIGSSLKHMHELLLSLYNSIIETACDAERAPAASVYAEVFLAAFDMVTFKPVFLLIPATIELSALDSEEKLRCLSTDVVEMILNGVCVLNTMIDVSRVATSILQINQPTEGMRKFHTMHEDCRPHIRKIFMQRVHPSWSVNSVGLVDKIREESVSTRIAYMKRAAVTCTQGATERLVMYLLRDTWESFDESDFLGLTENDVKKLMLIEGLLLEIAVCSIADWFSLISRIALNCVMKCSAKVRPSFINIINDHLYFFDDC